MKLINLLRLSHHFVRLHADCHCQIVVYVCIYAWLSHFYWNMKSEINVWHWLLFAHLICCRSWLHFDFRLLITIVVCNCDIVYFDCIKANPILWCVSFLISSHLNVFHLIMFTQCLIFTTANRNIWYCSQGCPKGKQTCIINGWHRY